MLSDLTRCNNYLAKHTAPPCTRCLAEHKNMRPFLISGQWLFLCDSCRVVYGLLDRLELDLARISNPAKRANTRARKKKSKLPDDASKEDKLRELVKQKIPFADFLERFTQI